MRERWWVKQSLGVGRVIEKHGELDRAVALLGEALGVAVTRIKVGGGVVGSNQDAGGCPDLS